MKKLLPFAICMLIGLVFAGCKGERIVGKDVRIGDVTDFYYTYENINFNATYQRYRFFLEDGEYRFFHERRERPGDYGPATEEDAVSVGTVALTEEEWNSFFECLKDGTVNNRSESVESGRSGPWTYLYWKKDRGVCQEFTFASPEAQRAFEELAAKLCEKEG
ncbi:MAG: hypothetical protein IJM21_05485 [Clostridia bacterium]|nr:hypothetical protein [Clostridia bacterium]